MSVTILGQAPTTITQLEAGIVARLTDQVVGLAIAPFPDKPATYRLTHPVGAILVAYRGAEYSEPDAVDEVVQERTLHFDLHVLARSLGGHAGAYVHLEAARASITGYQVDGFRKLVPRREAFLGEKEGVWMFALTVAAGTAAAELEEEETP